MNPRYLEIFVLAVCCTTLVAIAHAQQQPPPQPQPLLSPRDSTEITVNGKHMKIDYGRPSMRGRKIMGGLVPYNRWWRTGANEATGFVTEADLMLGGVLIPRGSYTLYTLPSETQWKLIINKQTGQWGTVYNPEHDLARINLKKRKLKNPLEKLTISLVKNSNSAGMLKIEWEYTSLSLSFRVLKNSNHTPRTQ